MTRIGSIGDCAVSGKAKVLSVITIEGFIARNTTRNPLGGPRDFDQWRRALGEGPSATSAAAPVPIRARVARQRVLDEFAVIAKKCRKRRRLSVEAVAQQSGIPARRIQQFERGAVAASEAEIVRLSAVYGVGASVITRRLERVFDQFAGSDIRAVDSILYLKWSKTRKATGSHLPAKGAGVASECHGARHRAGREFSIIDERSRVPATLHERILAECIQLFTLTACLQALVANVGTPIHVQANGNLPPPGSGAETNAIRMMKGDELLALVHNSLGDMVERLNPSTLRHRARCGADPEFTRASEIGDVVAFPDEELHAERARISGAMQLIAQYKAQALPVREVHCGPHGLIDTAALPCTPRQSPAEHSVSVLNCAIGVLFAVGYNLFELSGRCA